MGEHQFDDESGGQVHPGDALVDRYRTHSSDALAVLYAELGGGARALEAQRLAVLAVLDERDAWKVDGARDTAGWVAATDALRRVNARPVVEVARALVDLPALAAVAAAGRLSFDQLRSLCSLATAETDAHWAERGPSLEPGQLAAEAARANRATREAAQAQEAKRTLRIWGARGGGSRFAGYLPDVEAELLTERLDARASTYEPAPGEAWDPLHVRRADALVDLAISATAAPDTGGTAHLHVHAAAGAFGADQDGWATLADGTPIAREVLERLGCDATTQLLLHDETGAFTALGAVTRTIPRRIRRLLGGRDRCCRFPGCEMVLGLHAHHLRFWSRGGRTELPNLVLLCHRHHKNVHEGGWTLSGDPDIPEGLTFTSPTGRVVSVEPMGCTDRVRERIVPDPPPRPTSTARPHLVVDHTACSHVATRFRCTHLAAVRTRLRRDALRDLVDEGP